jgi:hypothetical protein
MDDKIFISCARRVLWGATDCILIPRKELPTWRLKFGKFEAKPSANAVAVRVSELGACAWGELKCQEVVESANPFMVGPRKPDEHGQDKSWGLFAGASLVYKSVKRHGRVRTVLSWYGHGEYDPESPAISRRERARIQYDPEYPDIELM